MKKSFAYKRALWIFALLLALSSTAKTALTAVPVPQAKPSVVANAPIANLSILERVFAGDEKLLTAEDAARYTRIFELQDKGDFVAADAQITALQNPILLGYVLKQRYLGQGYVSSYKELADWMRLYNDQPDAIKIYALARKKQPKGADALATPRRQKRGFLGQYDFDVSQMTKEVPAHIKKQTGQKSTARQDTAQAKKAEAYFYSGKTGTAYTLASAAAKRSGQYAPRAGWIAGLAAWKLGKYEEAADYFEQTASSQSASAWMSAAGAYWAARAHLRDRQPQKVSYWLHHAANYPRTFYGIIAIKMLGMEQSGFHWSVPDLSPKHIQTLTQQSAGMRALALTDIKRPDLAEQELRHINPGDDRVLQEAIIALSSQGMPALALRAGSTFTNASGKLYDSALYPDVMTLPEDGLSVDRALVYAFIRQESEFKTDAHNRASGARGLMQLMPATAKHVARKDGRTVNTQDLTDPVVNVDLGQKYLDELLQHPAVDNNLFKLATAYNAGPGKLSRWERSVHYDNDPLLFIESIPAAETRIFVERVLTNYWIYRIKFGQDTNSLDHIAKGEWPTYLSQDTHRGPRVAMAK